MSRTKKKLAGIVGAALSLAMVAGVCAVGASAADTSTTYTMDSSLSCYVSAMGGIDFGDGLVTGTTVTKSESGDLSITVGLTKSSITIYGVNCDTFIDATDSTPGYYDESGDLQDATYTLSTDTALNANSEAVNYVDSITFPVASMNETYTLYLYVNSNVMGVQFGDGTSTTYTATLTVDWMSLSEVATPEETTSQTATVTFNNSADNTYEVTIPATIDVDKSTKTASYQVVAENFDLESGAYVTVTEQASGTLTSGSDSVSYTNELADDTLTATGDTLDGTITVTDSDPATGSYTGTTTFTINFYGAE